MLQTAKGFGTVVASVVVEDGVGELAEAQRRVRRGFPKPINS